MDRASVDTGEAWINRMQRLLEEQDVLLTGLEEMAEEQAAAVRGEDTDALMSVLGRRQGMIDRTVEVNEQLAPLRRVWDAKAESLVEGRRAVVGALLASVRGRIERIMKRDEADRSVMAARRAGIATELGATSRAREAVRGYGEQGEARAASFQDRQG